MVTPRINSINQCLDKLSFATITAPFEEDQLNLKGQIQVNFNELDNPLSFEVIINPQYPFKYHNEETIKFINKDLLEYKHVMGNGMICIHTSHNIDLKEKLIIDFHSLKNWIIKYYINKEKNIHYEHIIAPQHTFKDSLFSFTFTEVDYEFKQHKYGFVNLRFLNDGLAIGQKVTNFLTHSFTDLSGKELTLCKWSSFYHNLPNKYHGIYVFVEHPPAIYDRFIFQDWESFIGIFKQDFLEFLHNCEKSYKKNKRHGQPIPLYIGYKISDTEIHWQIALLEIGKFPIKGVKKNQKWSTKLVNRKITWGISRNSSYRYFFGRGAFSEKLTTKKILILGTGAIGSMIARTLTKSGCTKIDLCDYDVKEPENICRAEFRFINGLADKVEELKRILFDISPFVEVGSVNQPYFEILSKVEFNKVESKKELEAFLSSYDLIFDCSTDNDLMYVLNQLELKCDLINISITNKAQQLVCAFSPNIYDFVTTQFSELLNQDTEDLYNPTGCWSPTFRASYNDINLLVQYALNHLNRVYRDNLPKNNFIIETGTEQEYKLELKQF
jgi:molybdopterin/thiamine biosynthesis adenylyltransferase